MGHKRPPNGSWCEDAKGNKQLLDFGDEQYVVTVQKVAADADESASEDDDGSGWEPMFEIGENGDAL